MSAVLEHIPLHVCEDCMGEFFSNQGRYSHYEARVWLCDDCFDEREDR